MMKLPPAEPSAAVDGRGAGGNRHGAGAPDAAAFRAAERAPSAHTERMPRPRLRCWSALRRAPSAQDRPVARPDRAAARRARPPAGPAAAGDPCRRHQRQGLDDRLPARHAGSRRQVACHVYTSPHLVRFNERIRLGRPGGGLLVEDATLIAAIRGGATPRTATSRSPSSRSRRRSRLHLFADHPADFTLLEVGLGGRFDATNVIAAPLAAVDHAVSHDHAEFLGDDLAGIAAEKAGILKRGAPGIVGAAGRARAGDDRAWRRTPSARRSFRHGRGLHGLRRARPARLPGRGRPARPAAAAPCRRAPGRQCRDWPSPRSGAAGIASRRRRSRRASLERGLAGAHAAAARRAARRRWRPRARRSGSTADTIPPPARSSPQAIAELEERVPRPLVLIAGMLTTKDPAGFFRPFAGLARHAMTVPVPDSDAGFAAEALAAIAMEADVPARPIADVATALRARPARPATARRASSSAARSISPASVLRENGPLPVPEQTAEAAAVASGVASRGVRSTLQVALRAARRPSCRTGSPFLNMISVGIERTP